MAAESRPRDLDPEPRENATLHAPLPAAEVPTRRPSRGLSEAAGAAELKLSSFHALTREQRLPGTSLVIGGQDPALPKAGASIHPA